MQLDTYQKFTTQLTTNLETDDRVVGLVALGSMAQQDYQPDAYSDHDFFVVTVEGVQEYFRQHFEWLPDADNIVFTFRETAHGIKVVYASGHLLEYAVFDEQELFLAKVNRYRVLLDRTSIAESLEKIEQASISEVPDPDFLFGQFITHLLVGVGRYARGEKLSGHQFIQGYAVGDLLQLIPQFLDSSHKSKLDNLNATRRFEMAYPELGAELNQIVLKDSIIAAEELLAFGERILKPYLSNYPQQAVETVAEYIQRAKHPSS